MVFRLLETVVPLARRLRSGLCIYVLNCVHGRERASRSLHSSSGSRLSLVLGPPPRLRYNSSVARTGPRLLAEEALYDYAIQALAKRSLTVDELRRRLARRAARPEATESVLARLTKAGYLDDKRLADSYAFFRKEYEGLGRRRVLTDLRRRGVDKDLAQDAVEESYQDADEDEMIAHQLRRKLGENYADRPIDDPKKLLKLYRSLVRAGFSSDKIGEALRAIAPDVEWPADFPDRHPDPDQEVFD